MQTRSARRPRRRDRTSGGAAPRTRRTPPRRRRHRDRPPPAARSSSSSSRCRNEWQAARSSGIGLLSGGAHFTAAVTHAPVSDSPSSIDTDVGWLASPARCIARNSQSPDRSPVNTRPVRLAPWAAGARPEHQDAGARITEAGHAATPVLLVAERGALLRRHLLTPGDQPRAPPARTHVVGQARERIHGLHTKLQHQDGETTARTPIVHVVRAGTSRPDTDHRQGAAGPRPGSASRRHRPHPGPGCRRAHRRARPGRRDLRVAARAGPRDRSPHRHGQRAEGARSTRACWSATSATGPAPS